MLFDNFSLRLLAAGALILCVGLQPVTGAQLESTATPALKEAAYMGTSPPVIEPLRRPSGSTSANPNNAYPEGSVVRDPETETAFVPTGLPPEGYMVKRGRNFPTLSGRITYTVPHGTVIKLKLATVPVQGLSICRKDIEGNLPPATLHERISAKTIEDLYIDHDKVIPQGTVFYGEVSRILPPRRVSRPGSLELGFDSFMTPDGRRFAFRACADNKKKSTLGTKLHGTGIVAGYAAGGAIVGVLAAYQIFGMQGTIAMHGYNIAGGAALGAVAAITYALLKRGPPAVLEPGDDLSMSIESDLLLPAAVEPTPQRKTENPFVQIEILKSKLIRDGLDGHLLELRTRITNNSDERLRSIDLYLQDDNNNRLPVVAGTSDDSEELFEIDPHSVRSVNFSFQVEYPKLQRKLVWLEHQSNRIITMQRLP